MVCGKMLIYEENNKFICTLRMQIECFFLLIFEAVKYFYRIFESFACHRTLYITYYSVNNQLGIIIR